MASGHGFPGDFEGFEARLNGTIELLSAATVHGLIRGKRGFVYFKRNRRAVWFYKHLPSIIMWTYSYEIDLSVDLLVLGQIYQFRALAQIIHRPTPTCLMWRIEASTIIQGTGRTRDLGSRGHPVGF